MRYRIEYLTNDANSVVSTCDVGGSLEVAELQAVGGSIEAKRDYGAVVFQIRDLADAGRIVALRTFENPLWRFWPDARDEVVH